MDDKDVLVPLEEVTRLILEVLCKVVQTKSNALQMAECLVAADYIGVPFKGLHKLPIYVQQIQNGIVDAEVVPNIIKNYSATALVDGLNGLGPVVGNFCMDIAINKAKNQGIGLVVARHSNAPLILSWYNTQAMKQGMLGLAFSNASPTVCPTRAKQPALGANPISVGASCSNDKFLLDMDLTSLSDGILEKCQRLKMRLPPSDLAMDGNGRTTYDPFVAGNVSCFYPLGGQELTGGYKGYALSIMVEVLCGILSGGKVGPNIPSWKKNRNVKESLSQCFMAINPQFFAPSFDSRLAELLNSLRNLKPEDPEWPVIVPGDREEAHMRKVDMDGGVYYNEDLINSVNELASSLDIEPLIPKSVGT